MSLAISYQQSPRASLIHNQLSRSHSCDLDYSLLTPETATQLQYLALQQDLHRAARRALVFINERETQVANVIDWVAGYGAEVGGSQATARVTPSLADNVHTGKTV